MPFSTFSKTPHSVAATLYNKPTVILVVDAYGFGEDPHPTLSADHMPVTIARFARGFGAIAEARIYVPDRKFLQQQENKWDRYGIRRVVSFSGETADDLTLDIYAHSIRDTQKRTYVLVGYRSHHSEVARRIALSGNVVVLAYTQDDDMLAPYHDLIVHVDMNYTILRKSARPLTDQPSTSDDEEWKPTMYDFITLLYETEQNLPFVGAKHFITRVMPRSGMGSVEACQELFNQANDQKVIELYSSKNINSGESDVTACKLNREHSEVVDALSVNFTNAADEQVSDNKDMPE